MATSSQNRSAGSSAGEIDEAQFAAIENLAEPCVGSCAMLGTANTMGCMAEALGLMLPGTATIPAVMARRLRAARQSGRRIVEMSKPGLLHAAFLRMTPLRMR